MSKLFKKYKIDRISALEESITRTNTIMIHWKSVPYNSSITYVSNNITILGYSVLECIENINIILNIRNIGETILLRRKIQSFLRDEYREFEHIFKAKTKNGEGIWLREITRVIYKDNCIAYGETLLINISHEKQIEENIISLVKNEEQFEESVYKDILPRSIMDNVITIHELQEFQDIFFSLYNCIGTCANIKSGPITQLSGNSEVDRRLKNTLGESKIHSIIFDTMLKITEEDKRIWIDTEYDNLKVIAKPLHLNNQILAVWVIFVFLNDADITYNHTIDIDNAYTQNKKQVQNLLELLGIFSKSLNSAIDYNVKYMIETKKRVFAEECVEEEKRRNEIFAYIIQLLDSEQDFDNIVFTLLEVVGKYLKFSNAIIFKVGSKPEFELVGEWQAATSVSYERFANNTFTIEDVNSNIVVISENDEAGKFRNLMKHSDAISMLSVPIIINGKPSMMATFLDNKVGRSWDVLTISFITDVCRMLQSIIYRRITKNSLISSYTALKEILDNIGSIIYVVDKNTKQILFCNELFKSTCKQDMVGKYCWDYHFGGKDSSCENCSTLKASSNFTEYCDNENDQCCEIRSNDITWVDGRLVSLCVITDVTEKKKYQNKIEFQANNDFLTGLFNRMRCEQDLATAIVEANKIGQNGAVLFIDLDDFKHINDGLGHQYGDLLLKMVSIGLQQIKGIVDKCYRLGGDEFLIIISPEEFKNLDYILASIKKLFSKPWSLENGDYYCTMSMGIVEFPKDGNDVNDLIKKADIAMYDAKNYGKNRYSFYNSNEDKNTYERLDIEKNLRMAVSADYEEFTLYIQPIIDSNTMSPVGGEVLLRWNCKQLGFLLPDEFIPIAEHIGLITHIGNHVLKQACFINKNWSDMGIEMYISVNLSVIQLLQNDIIETIEDILKETGVNPKNLVLEVTENLAINDMSRMKKVIEDIKSLGIQIALDDFGTGYSSLSYIKQINFDIIKVDRSFVADIEKDNYARTFIKLISELSKQLNVKICVEGVENMRQYEILKELDVTLLQGFHFGRPVPIKEFENTLQKE